MRTRSGYCGGVQPSPTYRRIGDHSETVEIDYDPLVVSYEDLLEVFFAGHDAGARSFSTQYRSAIFYRTDEEWAAAERLLGQVETRRGRIHTAVEPLRRFWLAEDYHQKFRLRAHKEVFADLLTHFPDEAALVDSTSAARLNGWLDGCSTDAQLDRELDLTGLGDDEKNEVRAYALRRPRILER